MNPLTIPFRRRWLRLLLALGYAATAAWLIYDLPPARTLEVIFALLLFTALLAHACTLCYRYTAFILRREFVRLDGSGITIRHNALPKGRELHLPWERVLDAWTDEVQRRSHHDRLLIAWKTADAVVAAHVALELKYARGSDSQGKRLRGAALGAYLVKHISARLPPAPLRAEKSADVPDGFKEIWYFRAPEAAFNFVFGCIYGLLALAFAILFLVGLYSGNWLPLLYIGAFNLLLYMMVYVATYDSIRVEDAGVNYEIFVALDGDGVHYWRYGMKDGYAATIPWELLEDVFLMRHYLGRGYHSNTLYLTFRPHDRAAYLWQIRYEISTPASRRADPELLGDEIVEAIRDNCPNLGLYRDLPLLYLPDPGGRNAPSEVDNAKPFHRPDPLADGTWHAARAHKPL